MLDEVLTDRALLLAVCEDLVPFMNGDKMCRLNAVLDDLVADRSGDQLEDEDRCWLASAVERGSDRRSFWAQELDRLKHMNIRVVSSVDKDYPVNLTLVHDAPPLLFVKGSIDAEDRRAVAVVGTRAATSEGKQIATDIATSLVKQGYAVVSGLALGIDVATHAAALNADGRTIAVFGTPIETVYPAAHKALANRIARTGACISQFLPGVRTGRWSFPARNLTGSGLALATVVVEASDTSGARHQAQAALHHGKRVFLVESLVTAQSWARQMDRDYLNATVVSDTETIVKELEAELAVPDDAVF